MGARPYSLEFAPAALRQLKKLDLPIRRKVAEDIEKLAGNPRPIAAQALSTREKLYRVYVGPAKNYRAIYQIRDERLLVLVVKVGDRRDVYRCLT